MTLTAMLQKREEKSIQHVGLTCNEFQPVTQKKSNLCMIKLTQGSRMLRT